MANRKAQRPVHLRLCVTETLFPTLIPVNAINVFRNRFFLLEIYNHLMQNLLYGFFFISTEEFVGHGSKVNCLALGHKSGRVMVTGGDDKKVNMWAVGKPNCIMVSCSKLI